MSTSGGYHEYIGGVVQYIMIMKGFYQVAPPHVS